jgi:dimethylamine corrinoid protein
MGAALTMKLVELDEAAVLAEVETARHAGMAAADIIAALQEGMRVIGDKYEAGEYYLSELIMSAEIFKGALATLGVDQADASAGTRGTVVLGTVKGDIHDIGKNIVASVLRANGFTVVDLGVDVPPEAFVAAAKDNQAQLVGLSCLLTTSFAAMEETIKALDAAGMRPRVRVLIGGGPVTREVGAQIGADGAGTSAQEAVALADSFVGGEQR